MNLRTIEDEVRNCNLFKLKLNNLLNNYDNTTLTSNNISYTAINQLIDKLQNKIDECKSSGIVKGSIEINTAVTNSIKGLKGVSINPAKVYPITKIISPKIKGVEYDIEHHRSLGLISKDPNNHIMIVRIIIPTTGKILYGLVDSSIKYSDNQPKLKVYVEEEQTMQPIDMAYSNYITKRLMEKFPSARNAMLHSYIFVTAMSQFAAKNNLISDDGFFCLTQLKKVEGYDDVEKLACERYSLCTGHTLKSERVSKNILKNIRQIEKKLCREPIPFIQTKQNKNKNGSPVFIKLIHQHDAIGVQSTIIKHAKQIATESINIKKNNDVYSTKNKKWAINFINNHSSFIVFDKDDNIIMENNVTVDDILKLDSTYSFSLDNDKITKYPIQMISTVLDIYIDIFTNLYNDILNEGTTAVIDLKFSKSDRNKINKELYNMCMSYETNKELISKYMQLTVNHIYKKIESTNQGDETKTALVQGICKNILNRAIYIIENNSISDKLLTATREMRQTAGLYGTLEKNYKVAYGYSDVELIKSSSDTAFEYGLLQNNEFEKWFKSARFFIYNAGENKIKRAFKKKLSKTEAFKYNKNIKMKKTLNQMINTSNLTTNVVNIIGNEINNKYKTNDYLVESTFNGKQMSKTQCAVTTTIQNIAGMYAGLSIKHQVQSKFKSK